MPPKRAATASMSSTSGLPDTSTCATCRCRCASRAPGDARQSLVPAGRSPFKIQSLKQPVAACCQGVSRKMSLRKGFVDAVGHTPLLRLNGPSEETGCEILGKAEFMNPGGSVKDRAARWIVQDAESRGLLKPGGTVVEGTAGNTGIGLAHVCNARGYKLILLMPDNQSPEKYHLLQALGAEVRKVPAVPYSNPAQYQHQAGRLAAELPNAIWSNQFDNTANRRAHVESTGPEIWDQ